MPLLAALLKALMGGIYRLIAGIAAQTWGVRIAVVTALAAAYVAGVAGFSFFVIPLFSKITATGYGQVLGLAFPPAAGTVLGGLVVLWALVLANRLSVRLLKAF